MSQTTTWRAQRNFRAFGRDVVAGETLDLTPAEVEALVWMRGTITPVCKEARRAVRVDPPVTWGPPVEVQERDPVRMRIRTGRSRTSNN